MSPNNYGDEHQDVEDPIVLVVAQLLAAEPRGTHRAASADDAADFAGAQPRLQFLAGAGRAGVAEDFAGRGIGGDGVSARQNIVRREEAQAGF